MNRGDFQPDSNLAAGADEAVQQLDQQVFQALLFNSFLNQQGHVRGKVNPGTRLQGILELFRELWRAPEETAALNLVAARALQITGATGAAIALARGSDMVCQATSGATAPDLGVSFSVQSGLSGECVRTASTLLCDDTETDQRVNREGARSLSVRSMMLAAIKQHGAVAGVLEIFSARAGTFSPDDVTALEILAEIVSAYLAYTRERALRCEMEADRGGVLDVVEQLTAALEESISEQPAELGAFSPGANDGSSLRLGRGLDLLSGGSSLKPAPRQE
jgi:transcriptional regulator with GAF, ATPase, and Fis domain